MDASGPDISPFGDITTTMNMLAGWLGHPVALVDTEWRVLAFSAIDPATADDLQRDAILSQSVPAVHARTDSRDRILRSPGPVAFPAGRTATGEEVSARIGIRVRHADRPLGMLWILGDADALTLGGQAHLRRVSDAVAAHLEWERISRTADRARSAALVRAAVDGSDASASGRLGFSPERGMRIAAIVGEGSIVDLRDTFDRELTGLGVAAATTVIGDRMIVLGDSGLHGALSRLMCTLPVLAGTRAGVGGTVRRAADLPESAREAGAALTANAHAGTAREIDEVLVEAAVREIAGLVKSDPGLLVHRLSPALDDGVRAYVDSGADARRAAEVLHVHPNTVRYRVRALRDRGTDLDDADTRLLLALLVRATAEG
ncbi:PucR family transcriptional regulator [Microbacterium allomyrinae]|uniref:Helix-turn-helix domain-containing protein n=1 Tax=Microbacterium allomyrinae TaxID=2830666 RepID=A0A9X1LTA8_9MICO|nr:helix-turn-helix domain-containing protein [Microbacterium allomyrinae]MCC2031570.1 helix-turn-helix domain-containing protein [Microbacterium allomyrinae]